MFVGVPRFRWIYTVAVLLPNKLQKWNGELDIGGLLREEHDSSVPLLAFTSVGVRCRPGPCAETSGDETRSVAFVTCGVNM